MRRDHPIDRLIPLAGELQPGTVSLVGAGPGDSTLISIRGAVRITQADIILHDKLIGPELLNLARPDAVRIFVGKWRGEHVWTQEEINRALVEHARAGRRVVRLKGGDPFVFGRGGEECEALAAAGIPFEVVPGITAAFGAPASAGIPLTHRGLSRSFALVSGHADPDDLGGLDFTALARIETVAFYMGVKHLDANCTRLIAAGMSPRTPVAVIRWGTRPEQRTVVGTLADIAQRVERERIQPPAMVLVGRVVELRERIAWFERRPLYGQRIAVTRAAGQADVLSGLLRAEGAEVIDAPTIAIEPVPATAELDDVLHRIGTYQWLVLTSSNGVEVLFAHLERLGLDARALAGPKLAAVGSATSDALHAFGIRPDLVPPEAVGESLAETLAAHGVRGSRILLLRAERGRAELPAALRAAGATCDDVPIYRTVCPPALSEAFLNRFDAGELDWITFTSPSTFSHLLELLGPVRRDGLSRVRLASIGPVTTRAITAAGLQVDAEADPHDSAGLAAAICRACGR